MSYFRKVISTTIALNLAASFSYAATLTARAGVEIVEPTNFQQLSSLDIDGIKIPDSGEVTVSLNKKSNENSNNKKIIHKISGGEYIVSGFKTDSIQISASSQDKIDGIEFDEFSINYQGNEMQLPSVAQKSPEKKANFKLGAQLNIASLAKAGYHKPSIALDISFE